MEMKCGNCLIHQKYIVCVMTCLSLILLHGTRYSLIACIPHVIGIDQPGIIIQPGQSVCRKAVTNEPEELVNAVLGDWTKKQGHYVYSSFYVGYAVFPLFSGILSDMYGAKFLLSTGVLACALVCVVQPIILKTYPWYWTAMLQCSLGMAQGIALPAVVNLLAQWVPKDHQTLLISYGYSGGCLGGMLSGGLCRLFVATTENWSNLFYVWAGAIGVWYIFFMLIIHSRPAVHPCVSLEEKTTMMEEIGPDVPISIPWKSILSDRGVWAIVCGQLTDTYLMVLINTHLPEFLILVLSCDLKQTSYILLSAFLSQWVSTLICGYVADRIIRKVDYSPIYVRCTCVVLGNFVASCVILMSTNLGCNKIFALCLIILTMICRGATVSALIPNILDITRHHGGVVEGINCIVPALVGITVPQIVCGMCWRNTLEAWKRLYWLTLAICFKTTCFYLIFSRRNRAHWDIEEQAADEEVKEVQKS